jgi:hypothetical protein
MNLYGMLDQWRHTRITHSLLCSLTIAAAVYHYGCTSLKAELVGVVEKCGGLLASPVSKTSSLLLEAVSALSWHEREALALLSQDLHTSTIPLPHLLEGSGHLQYCSDIPGLLRDTLMTSRPLTL